MFCAILTLFPEAVRPYLDASILGIAQRIGRVRFHLVDFRDYADDRQGTVDDRPFGGGPGMVLKPKPIFDAVEDVERDFGPCHKVLLSPRGRVYDHAAAARLAERSQVLLLCGRYEGFDERIRLGLDWEEVSLGDFVLSGGELPALTVLEAAVRLLPGVLGDAESAEFDSFAQEGEGGVRLLDHPHYTRPRVFRDLPVPDVLSSGDHGAVAAWRRAQALELTRARRQRDGAQ